MIKDISQLVTGVTADDYNTWSKPGIHAILFDKKTKEFQKDHKIVKGDGSWHLMNPISPGWTSALAMAEDWTDRIMKSIK
jgi:L-2-hydroxyglutarate oxidase